MAMSPNLQAELVSICLHAEVLIHYHTIELLVDFCFPLSTFHFLLIMPAVTNTFYDGHQITQSCENSIIKGYEFYGDVVTMSEYLYEYCKNETVTLKDIISLAFGVRFYFL